MKCAKRKIMGYHGMSQGKKTSYAAVLGQVIEEKRNSLGISQGEMAQKLHLSQSSLSRLETGKAVMSTEQLYHVAKVLMTEPNAILAEVDERMELLSNENVEVMSAKDLQSTKASGPGLGTILVGAALTAFIISALTKK